MMKCLLLLLASGLVSADKLDRTYLPPPGAEYAGGSVDDLYTPLEFQKLTYPGTVQNSQPKPNAFKENKFTDISGDQELDNGIAKTPATFDYSIPTFPTDFNQNGLFPIRGFPTTARPETSSYNSFLPTLPNSSYLPAKELATGDQQSFIGSTSNPLFETTSRTNPNGDPSQNGTAPGYFYFPAQQPYENNIQNQVLNNNILLSNAPSSRFVQNPNQVKDGYLTSNKQTFTPKIATADDIVQNYQPNSFGYYGGNPMIMTSQYSSPQEFENIGFTRKFGEYENIVPKMSPNQGNQKNYERTTAQPFQTPLVGTNVQKVFKSSNSKTTSMPNYTTKKTTVNNTPVNLNQRNNLPVRSRFRSERPLAKLDRNAVILNYENIITPEGFSYSFDTSNGIHADESGTAIDGVKAKGSYSYSGDDGKIYSVTYTADENGFQPKGDHLPTPPPIPEAIKKVIEQAYQNKAAGVIDDGSYDENKYGYLNYQGAMDRYRPLKNNKVFNVNRRIGSNISKQNAIASLPNGNINENNNQNIQLSKKRPQNPVNNGEETKNESPKQANQSNVSNSDTKVTEANGNKKQGLYQNQRPITSVNNYNQNKKGENPSFNNNISYEIQNPNVKSKPDNSGAENYNKIQYEPQSAPGVATVTDDGYYYIPPFIQFNPVSNETVYKKNTYFTNEQPAQENIETAVTKRIDIDRSPIEQTNNRKNIFTPTSSNEYTTRKPYISGPNDHDKNHYYDDLQNTTPVTNDGNQANVDSNDLYYSSYVPTTPITSQTIQYENQPTNGYFYPNQYSQTTEIPIKYDQNLPNAVENRVNVPSGTPGVRVSQDLVTTTYKPALFKDGVLEVNQNVKIYGLGKSEPNDFGKFSDKMNYNNKLYTTAIPSNDESRFIGTFPDNIYGRPAEVTDQVNTNQGNQFLTTGGPFIDSTVPMNKLPTPVFGPDANPDYEKQFKGETEGFLKNPDSTVNDFKNSELTSGGELTTPSVPQSQSRTKQIIGEDFSGPKQPQRFDPVTGYQY